MMWKKIWRNRLEFYPYLAILAFWFFGSFVQALTLLHRPVIVALGLVTIPAIGLVAVAMVRTYRTLPKTASLSAPGDDA